MYDFYRLIALLEAQLAHTPETTDEQNDSMDSLTLGRIAVWTEEWRLKMRMMSTLVQGAADVHGGALVSLIHGYTENGDPFIRGFVSELLEEVRYFQPVQRALLSLLGVSAIFQHSTHVDNLRRIIRSIQGILRHNKQ